MNPLFTRIITHAYGSYETRRAGTRTMQVLCTMEYVNGVGVHASVMYLGTLIIAVTILSFGYETLWSLICHLWYQTGIDTTICINLHLSAARFASIYIGLHRSSLIYCVTHIFFLSQATMMLQKYWIILILIILIVILVLLWLKSYTILCRIISD